MNKNISKFNGFMDESDSMSVSECRIFVYQKCLNGGEGGSTFLIEILVIVGTFIYVYKNANKDKRIKHGTHINKSLLFLFSKMIFSVLECHVILRYRCGERIT